MKRPSTQNPNVPLLVSAQAEPNPYTSASLFQKAFFNWIHPLLAQGQKAYLQKSMLYPIPENFTSEVLMQRFSKHWSTQKRKPRPVLRTFFLAFPREITIFFFLELVGTALSFTNPIVINRVILYVDSVNKETKTAIFLLAMIFISKLVALLTSTICVFKGNILGTIMTSSLNMKIYEKSLKFPLHGSSEYNEGKLVNMIQMDLENIYNLFYNIFSIVILPLQIIVGLAIMYHYVDIAFLAAVAVVVIMGLLNLLVGKLYLGFQSRLMKAKDERTKASNEMLNRINHIKLNAEEHCSYNKLSLLRRKELNFLNKQRVLDIIYILIFWMTPVLVIIFTFLVFIMMDSEINSVQVFTVLSLFQTLSGSLNNLPLSIASLINSMISLKRVEEFLLQRELNSFETNDDLNQKDSSDSAIIIKNGHYFWEKNRISDQNNDSEKNGLLGGKSKKNKRIINNNNHVQINRDGESSENNTIIHISNDSSENCVILKNIDLKIAKGSFVAIVGEIGSGKSSLMNALLDEMRFDENDKPTVVINGSLAYTSQKTWIQNLTIRENIIFGLPFDKDKYALVKKLSCLDEDLKVLKHGDETMIGDKGINLSGGQKARVSLARSLYSDREIYLFDDILAAVDSNVGRSIFNECFLKHLKNKTRVLCTHNVSYLEHLDYIYVLHEGRIVEQGTYQKIKHSLLLPDVLKQSKKIFENSNLVSTSEGVSSYSYSNPIFEREEESKTVLPIIKFQELPYETTSMNKILDDLILDEDRQVGHVSLEVVKTYLSYNGGAFKSNCTWIR